MTTRRLLAGLTTLIATLAVGAIATRAPEAAPTKTLDIYFLDTEGGAATLIVTPRGESILFDSGNRTEDDRDANRILKAAKDAKIRRLDHYVTSHWHRDHFGAIGAVAEKLKIRNFWDRGVPESIPEDKTNFPTLISIYNEISKGESKTLAPGDVIPLKPIRGGPPLEILCVSSDRKVIGGEGAANAACPNHKPKPEDKGDNARSVGLKITYGEFNYLCLGDLTWNIEHALACPTNRVGEIDLFQVTHHGLPSSNNPVLVKALNPTVAVFENGTRKGAHPEVFRTLRSCSGLQAIYQVHRKLDSSPADQAPLSHIANLTGPGQADPGEYIKASVAPDGNSFTITVTSKGRPRTFTCR